MDITTTTPTPSTRSGDEESGTQQPTVTTTTEKQEQPIITKVTTEVTTTTTSPPPINKQQQQQLGHVVVVVVDVTKPTIDKTNKETTKTHSMRIIRWSRFDFATLLIVLIGLLVTVAITIPIVMNNHQPRRRTSAAAAGSAAGFKAASDGDENEVEEAEAAADEEPFVLDPALPEGTPTLVMPGGGGGGTNHVGSSAGAAGSSTTITGSSSGFEPLWKVSDSIGYYDESVVQGYADTSDFQADLTTVAKMMVNLIVARSTGMTTPYGDNKYYAGGGGMALPVMAAPSPAMPTVENGVNDFGSNNQEKSVEEGDKIVSDGTRVFASYGDYIIAWDVATGKQLAMAQMDKFGPSTSTSIPVDYTESGQAGKQMGDSSMPVYYEPKPTIMSLLLLNSRLIVAVDGGYWYPQTGAEEERILSSYGQTRVLVYETESLTLHDPNNGAGGVKPNMNRLFSRDYNGVFVAFRAIGENLHTVTTSSINTYSALVAPVERYNYEQNGQQPLTDQEYMSRVKADAEGKLIPNFVQKLTKELTQADGTLPKLARISKFLTHTSDIDPEMDQYYLYDNGLLNSVTLVHSMNVFSEQPATSSAAGVFLPSYSASVYSSQEYMIVAGPGYDYSPWRMASTESTYLMAMKLNGDASTPYSIGTVEGSFLNQRSFDVVDNVLRVATTIQNFWRWAQPMPIMPIMPVVDPMPMSDPTLVLVDVPEPDVVTAAPIAVPLPPVIIDDTQSSTENYIITLKLPGEDDENHGTMQELDRIKLGKPDETFTSVRFYDNVAYAVTFERTDPFYVLNVTDPSDLQVLAEVNITGFSSYLHSMNDENNMILAIGQEADEFGVVLGLQISMFDVRDVNDIKVLRHTIETDPNVYSDTAGMWDVMAIRFNRETGRLIIPVDMSNWQQPSSDFHGFRVFSVTENDIQEDENCRVEMGNANQLSNTNMCYYCASLEPRAMIMNGNMMLTKSHFVKSVDMNDCTTQWQFAVNSTPDPNTGCCGYY